MKVALVDSDFFVRFTLKGLVRHVDKNIKLFSTSSALEALGYLHAYSPDLLIIDTTLTKYSGVELAHHLNTNFKQFNTKLSVIVLHDGQSIPNLSNEFVIFNKNDKEVINKIYKLISINIDVLNNKNIHVQDNFKTNLAKNLINTSVPYDKLQENLGFNLFKRIKFIAIQNYLGLMLLLFRTMSGSLKDDNLEQEKVDQSKYRLNAIPSVAITAVSFIIIFIQILLLILGGFTINNIRTASVLASGASVTTIDFNKADYDGQKISLINNKLQSTKIESGYTTITFQQEIQFTSLQKIEDHNKNNNIQYQLGNGEDWYYLNTNNNLWYVAESTDYAFANLPAD